MAKKQQAPESIERQFNKALFKIGEPVYFSWLGAKKYGYVRRHKQTNWGIQYTVEANNTRYPCGIQIKEHRTHYATGCIFFEETNAIGTEELARRIQNSISPSRTTEYYTREEETRIEGKVDNPIKRKLSNTNRRKNKLDSSGADSVAIGNESGSNGMHNSNTKKRKDTPKPESTGDILSKFIKFD